MNPCSTKQCVESSSKSPFGGGEFDHLVTYSLACTFENKVVSARKYESIYFWSLNEVMNDDELECLNVEKIRRSEALMDRSTGRVVDPEEIRMFWNTAHPVEQLALGRARPSTQVQ